MNKRVILSLFFIALLLPLTCAAPTVTVLEPNGGEILTGDSQIIFQVQNTSVVDEFDANIFLSTVQGLFSNGTKVEDVNLLETCAYSIKTQWLEKDNIIAGLPTDIEYYRAKILDLDGIKNLFTQTIGGNEAKSAFTWNTVTSSWDANADLNRGLGPSTSSYRFIDFFEFNGDFYATKSGTSVIIYKFLDSNISWHKDANFRSGLPSSVATNHDYLIRVIENFSIGGITDTYAIFLDNHAAGKTLTAKGYVYDFVTSKWVRKDTIVGTGPDANYIQYYTPASSPNRSSEFIRDGVLYSIQDFGTGSNGTGLGVVRGLRYDASLGKWISDTTILTGLTTTYNAWNHIHEEWINGKEVILSLDMGASQDTDDISSFENGSGYDTQETRTCSIAFDTTRFGNYPGYYIDINAFDSLGLDDTDSSDGSFVILNWDTTFIECECVSNCSSCTIDANGFIAIPETDTTDMEIKITNESAGSKNFKMNIENSDNSGRQYKIHTATESEYVSGIWNYSDTLTFGSTNYDAVQKVWDGNGSQYIYSFTDTIGVSEDIAYYKFEYFKPAFHWKTVYDPPTLWDNQLIPSVSDNNGIITDLFFISTYSDMSSFLTDPKFPEITSNLANSSYVFQFTTKADSSAPNELKAGGVSGRDITAGTTLNFSPFYRTTSVSGLENFAKIETSATTPREVSFQNYTVVERGYFTKPLKVFSKDGSHLPITIVDTNKPDQYVIEGSDFLIKSEYFDANSKIDRYEITTYIDAVVSTNKIKKWTFNASGDGLIPISEVVGGLIDLTANAPDRDVILTLRLVDENANYYEIQSEEFTMRQFPTTTKDVFFQARQDNKKIGDHPKGRMTIETIAPETIIGVEVHIQDLVSDNNTADFNKTFYKDTDFTCNAFDCSFDYEFEDYIFPASGVFRMESWLLVTTEKKSNDNDLLYDLDPLYISWITFDTARIFQTFQRADRTYRNDEVIPLVVQLRDSTGLPLKDRIIVKLQLEECNGDSGDVYCEIIDINYMPGSVIYDQITGYSNFFFRELFVEEDYTLLSDGNYFRVKAFIEDPENVHETNYIPVLADKCDTIDETNFFENLLTMNFFNWGCSAYTDAIVAIRDNNADEQKILIDEDHSTSAPTQYWWMCTAPDQNYVYSDVLAQDTLCWVWYLLGEKPIDKFRFTLGNENSDYSETEDKYKQYIQVEVPYEIIAFNDLQILKQSLQADYQTDSIGNVGDIIYYTADQFLGALSPIITTPVNFFGTGIIHNTGWQMGAVESGNTVDFNFNTPLDPRTISGFLMYRIRDLDVINKKDYEETYPAIENISTKKLVRYAVDEGINLDSKTTTVDVFVSGTKILSNKSESKIVIDEIPTKTRVNPQNLDSNTSINTLTVPTKIDFEVISDMIYDNETTFKRRYLTLPYRIVIQEKASLSTILNSLTQNWVMYVVLGGLSLLIISRIYSNFKPKDRGE